jgi:hypothetical protein
MSDDVKQESAEKAEPTKRFEGVVQIPKTRKGKPKPSNYCGTIWSDVANRAIDCLHTKNESCSDCTERLLEKHQGKGKPTKDNTSDTPEKKEEKDGQSNGNGG